MRRLTLAMVLGIFLIACNNSATKEPVSVNYEEQLQKAIAEHPDSLLLREQLIQYYRDSANYDRAISAVNEVLKKDSSLARFWKIKATLEVENEDTLPAIRSLEKVTVLDPTPESFTDLGNLYAASGSPQALEIANVLANVHKKNRAAFFIRGLYYSNTNDGKKAIEMFDNCLAIDYTDMEAYREKAIAFYNMGKYNDGVAVLNRAITLQNNFDEGYYWRGMCLEKIGKIEEAIASYKSALLYSPDYIEAQEALDRLVKN